MKWEKTSDSANTRARENTLIPSPTRMLQSSGDHAGASISPAVPAKPNTPSPTIHGPCPPRARAAIGAMKRLIGTAISETRPNRSPASPRETPASISTCGNQPIAA